MYKRIMVFGAHPDDEIVMACAIAKMAAEGVEVTVITMTDGSEGYPDPKLKNKIVALRKKEAKACDRALGIKNREFLDAPDMALSNSKENLKKCIKLIRKYRPEALFTHGPEDVHRDHRNAHALTRDAYFHASEPVAVELGAPCKKPWLYYYKSASYDFKEVNYRLPYVSFEVTGYAEKELEAWKTQRSQYSVFRKTEEDFNREIEDIKKNRKKVFISFCIAETNTVNQFLENKEK